MPKAKALRTINQAIKNYQNKLINFDFLIIYFENSEILSKVVTFKKHNFLHLTGIIAPYSPNLFYDSLLAGKISEKDFELKKDGTTKLKLDVLENLYIPFYSSAIIGIFNNRLKLKVKCDNGLGHTKIPYLTIGLEKSKKSFFPKTLLKEDIRKNCENLCPTQLIFKKIDSELNYSSISYKHKNIDLKIFLEEHKNILIDNKVCSVFIESILSNNSIEIQREIDERALKTDKI